MDADYADRISSAPLFSVAKNKPWDWTDQLKTEFAGVFYHIRGYFIDFMWFVANFSTHTAVKAIILDNIGEEIGVDGKVSHEMLYEAFAKACGVDIQEEIKHKHHFLPFVKTYNKAHIDWLQQNDELSRLAAFAAYERLDNVDYRYLYQLAQSMNLSSEATKFFKVHTLVEHFAPTLPLIEPEWSMHSEKIKSAFQFIYDHQLAMWDRLSEHLLIIPKAKSA